MKRRLVCIIVTITAVVVAIVVRNAYKANMQKRRDSASQAALVRYSQSFKPGLTRKDLEDGLRAGHTIFFERCCYDERSAFADVVQVGEEDAPWYCSEWPVYVVFEFRATSPKPLLKPSDSDVFKNVHLASNGEGCL